MYVRRRPQEDLLAWANGGGPVSGGGGGCERVHTCVTVPRGRDQRVSEGMDPVPEGKDGSATVQTGIHTLSEYIEAVKARHMLFHPTNESRSTTKGYVIDPVGAAPHGTQINAMALSMDSSILLSAGADGYVRWYDLPASMNGKNMLTQNLRNSFVEGVTKGGVLMTWWGHAYVDEGADLAQAADAPLSPVHSLACERSALWGVSGGECGTINLWGLRHGAGSLRHVFRKHTDAVSALQLDPSEQHLISGGWDRGVYQWDLNTGQVVRSFDGHTGQVSSIAFRPLYVPGEQPVPSVMLPGAPDGDAMDVDTGATGAPAPLSQGDCSHVPEDDDALEQELNRTMDQVHDEPTSDPSLGADAENDGDNDSLFGGDRDAPTSDIPGADQDADGEPDIKPEPPSTSMYRDDTPTARAAPAALLPKPADRAGPAISLPGTTNIQTQPQPQPQPQPEPLQPKEEPLAQQPELERRPRPNLPKPMFGSMDMPWQYDADVSRFSEDILMTSTLSGQVMLWDRRVGPSSKHGVRALGLPPGTPPWCTGTSWNHTGDRIYVGRRNELVEEWDVRMLPDVTSTAPGTRTRGTAPAYVRALRMPRGSGPVSSVAVLPNNRHIVWYVRCAPRSRPVARLTMCGCGTPALMRMCRSASSLDTTAG